MKRLVMSLFLVVFTLCNSFGIGGKERKSNVDITDKDNPDKKENTVIMEEKHFMGKTVIRIIPKKNHNKYKFAFIKKGDKFYNPDTNTSIDIDEFVSILNKMNKDTLVHLKITTEDGKVINFDDCNYGIGDINITEDEETLLYSVEVKDSTVEIELDLDGKEEEIGFAGIIEKDDGTYAFEYVSLITTPPFFKNEIKILEQGIPDSKFDPDISEEKKYTIRALSLLATFFGNEKDIFEAMVNTVMGVDISDYDFVFPEGQEQIIKAEFKRAFNSHIQYRYEEKSRFVTGDTELEVQLPFLEFLIDENKEKTLFNEIYGDREETMAEQGKTLNPYITAYLLYCYRIRKKPVLSNLIEEELRKIDIAYDYSKLDMISQDEGISLAKAALKYLTWCVEYTPYPGASSIDTGYSKNYVYKENYLRIIDWIGDEEMSNRQAKDNYFQYSIDNVPRFTVPDSDVPPYSVHILQGEYTTSKITLVGRIKDGENMELSRIDMWTSENIAWIPGRIAEVKATPQNDYTHRLYDKKIYLDKDQNRNVHLEQDPKSVIEITYKFTKPEKIGGLLIIRGWGTDMGKDRKEFGLKDGHGGETFQIKYKKDGSEILNKVIGTHDANYGEYNFYYKNNQVYIANRSAYPGYIISRGNYSYFDKKNENVTYIYIVFPTPIEDCKEITIQDKTTNKFLNIAELMVFPDNPIKYVTERNIGDESDPPASEIFSGITVRERVNAVKDVWKNTDGTNYNIGSESEDVVMRFVLFNGNPSGFMDIKGTSNVNWLEISMGDVSDLKQIVVWEPETYNNTISNVFSKEFIVLLDHNSYMKNFVDFYDTSAVENMNIFYKREWLKTPYLHTWKELDEEGNEIIFQTPVAGNPIPYAPKGIDSPRTFAYKMNEQYIAREWYKDETDIWSRFPTHTTTLATGPVLIENFNEGYVNEVDLFWAKNRIMNISNIDFKYEQDYNPELLKYNNKYLKPFLPGLMLNNKAGYVETWDSLYAADKIAGTDSLGILMGAIAMSDIGEGDRLLNVFNVDVRKVLDGFYKINPSIKSVDEGNYKIPLKGLDDNGKPIFYSEDKYSFIDPSFPCRFTRQDLERCSLLVPDLRLVRIGDLVVRTGDDIDPHIGIIVKTPWDGMESIEQVISESNDMKLNDIMSEIYVITTRRGFRMATLCRWGNRDANTFGGFTDEPEQYHVRRLLKLPEGTDMTGYHEVDDWELIELMFEELDCELILPDDPYTGQKNHWIPNTMITLNNERIPEKLDGTQIKIRGISTAGVNTIPEHKSDIWFAKPDDPYFNKAVRENGNIQCNKGGGIEIFALFNDGEHKEYKFLVRFERNTSVDTMDNPGIEDYYNIVKNNTFFDDNGMGKGGARLYCDGEYLIFMDNNGNKTDSFAISAINPVRPGDDFQLRFCLAYDHDANGMVRPGDFVACYDKKLLWRANLYIDEGVADDWNNMNPWYQPDSNQPDYNDWGKSQADGADVNGGQIEIASWTRWDVNEIVSNAVAYSWACTDSVEDFNADMEEQRAALSAYYSPENTTKIGDNPDPSHHRDWSPWEETYAPPDAVTGDSNWNNYCKGIYDKAKETHKDPIKIKDKIYYPYLPGYSSYKKDIGLKRDYDVKRSAGVECRGLVQRCASYDKNQYTTVRDITTRTTWYGGMPPSDNLAALSWPITNLNQINVGDLIGCDGHVGIVCNIVYNGDSREITEDNVYIIESTGAEWMVRKDRTISDWKSEKYKNIIFYRIKTE